MVVNGLALLSDPPIVTMFTEKMQSNGVSHGLSEVGYDIRIKQDVMFFPGQNVGTVQVREAELFNIHDGNFVLASSMEEFDMPRNLMGIVHDKSTWARHGLSVFNTVIEPGWRGFLTLELVYHGRQALHIAAGSGIAQVVFHQIANPAQYIGKYQDQANEPVAPILTQI